jgi:hypothetical protein
MLHKYQQALIEWLMIDDVIADCATTLQHYARIDNSDLTERVVFTVHVPRSVLHQARDNLLSSLVLMYSYESEE